MFAILFGSHAEDRATDVSDIDIGIYTNRDVEILELGLMVNRLEQTCKKKIDVVVLNSLQKRNPVLAYEIVANGQLILCKDHERLIEFKKNVFLYYLDILPLKHQTDKSVKDRLNSGRFGDRNYAGAA